MLNKAQKWVFQELLQVRSWLPFVLVRLHTDRRSARYCRHEKIAAAREPIARFTEQKLVREHVGKPVQEVDRQIYGLH